MKNKNPGRDACTEISNANLGIKFAEGYRMINENEIPDNEEINEEFSPMDRHRKQPEYIDSTSFFNPDDPLYSFGKDDLYDPLNLLRKNINMKNGN